MPESREGGPALAALVCPTLQILAQDAAAFGVELAAVRNVEPDAVDIDQDGSRRAKATDVVVAVAGASSALGQSDYGMSKRNPYGLDAGGNGQSSGQGLRLPGGGGGEDWKKEKRGNTPPGSDRAGDKPAAGAIVDPAGVTIATRSSAFQSASGRTTESPTVKLRREPAPDK